MVLNFLFLFLHRKHFKICNNTFRIRYWVPMNIIILKLNVEILSVKRENK